MLKSSLLAVAVLCTAGLSEAQHRSDAQAQRLAQSMARTSQELSRDAGMVAQRSFAGGQTLRGQRFNELSQSASQLSGYISRQVLPTLRGRNDRAKDQAIQSIGAHFARLDRAASSITLMPQDISHLVNELKGQYAQIQRLRFGYGPGPGPIGPVHPRPRPPVVGSWNGTCEVVLEAIWGTDIQKFYGYSHAPSRSQAVQQAQLSALQQCQASMAPLMKCTVVHNRCSAARH